MPSRAARCRISPLCKRGRRFPRRRAFLATVKERNATFCEQKVAKNLVNLGRAGFTGTGPKSQQFLRRFFQKAATFFLSKAWHSPKTGGCALAVRCTNLSIPFALR